MNRKNANVYNSCDVDIVLLTHIMTLGRKSKNPQYPVCVYMSTINTYSWQLPYYDSWKKE
jgi:hypothetical protein